MEKVDKTKKKYLKPKFVIIELRSEERLANCQQYTENTCNNMGWIS